MSDPQILQRCNERILRGEPAYPMHLWIDQHGEKIWACTRRELVAAHNERYGTKTHHTVAKMYMHKKDGRTVHCGYVVGDRWYSRYAPVEIEA